MAEAILRARQMDNVTVRSAGLYAQDGHPISSHAMALIEEANMPHTPRSRAVTSEDLDWADVVLTMTETHKVGILYQYPAMQKKVFTLKEFVGLEANGDVHDPFGGNLETYRQTFGELSSIIDRLEQRLMEELA